MPGIPGRGPWPGAIGRMPGGGPLGAIPGGGPRGGCMGREEGTHRHEVEGGALRTRARPRVALPSVGACRRRGGACVVTSRALDRCAERRARDRVCGRGTQQACKRVKECQHHIPLLHVCYKAFAGLV